MLGDKFTYDVTNTGREYQQRYITFVKFVKEVKTSVSENIKTLLKGSGSLVV
jgi:hypothetical protein